MLGTRFGGRMAPDERLVSRVRAGDTYAFEGIYDRYARSIHSFCRHMLRQPDDADDAVQHTFLAAYQAMRHSGQPIDVKPWLFTIARNRCLSMLRARQREPSVRGDAAPEPATEGLLAAVERRESLRDLLRDIGTLPEDQRSALILTQLGTLKHEEVGRVLGVPTEKVRALVFQARNSLISARHARETACQDIRHELATLTGGGLRRGNLRRHLVTCSACRDYQLALKRQRAAIVVLLPVVAQPALRQKVLGEIAGGAAGAGAAGAGVSGTLGGLAANGVVLKVGIAATVAATGVGVAALTGNVHRAFGDSGQPPVANVVAQHPAVRAPSMQVSSAVPAHGRKGSSSRPSTGPRTSRRSPKTPPKQAHHQDAASPLRAADQTAAHDPGGGTGGTGSTGSAGSAPSGAPTQKPTPPGLTNHQGSSPPGQAKKNGTHVPPGQAKKNGTHVPPGQAKKNPAASTPAPSAGPPPENSSPGNGGGNGNGGNGNAGNSGHGSANGGNGNGSANGNGSSNATTGNGQGKGKGH
jgi:RNA polymerase sigma factor (sigma-70 family)